MSAIGRDAIWEAKFAIKSIKLNTIGSHVTLFTDTPPTDNHQFDEIRTVQPKPDYITNFTYNQITKISALITKSQEQDQFTYVDNDVYVAHDPTIVFNNDFNIGVTMDVWRQQDQTPLLSGVIFVRRNTQFYEKWLKLYKLIKIEPDQYSFRQLLNQEKNVKVLPPEFNAQTGTGLQLSGKMYIAHCHYASTIRNPAIHAVFINQTTDCRIWTPWDNKMVSWVYNPETFEQLTKTHTLQPEHQESSDQFMKET